MDTLFWTNLKANNNQIKFEGSKVLRKGVTSSLRIDDRWLYCCRLKERTDRRWVIDDILENLFYDEKWNQCEDPTSITWAPWRKKKGSLVTKKNKLIDSILEYKETHQEVTFKFDYWSSDIFGTEADLISLLTTIPELAKTASIVTIPSSEEAAQLIKDGHILMKTPPKMPFRAKTKAGYIKKSSLEKVVRQVELSPDRFEVSGWFKHKAAGQVKNWYSNMQWTNTNNNSDQIHMSSSNIYFKSEHDIALFALIDPSLTKKIEKISMDPTLMNISKLNSVRKVKHVRKDKKLV